MINVSVSVIIPVEKKDKRFKDAYEKELRKERSAKSTITRANKVRTRERQRVR